MRTEAAGDAPAVALVAGLHEPNVVGELFIAHAAVQRNQLPLPQARKLLDKLPYPLDFGSEKEAAQKAAQALQNAGAVIFTLGFEPD